MNGPDDIDDLDPADVARLNDLVRRSRPEPADGPGFDHRLLLAYLRGHVSTDDASRVQHALADSVEQRHEFVYLAGLHDRDIQARFDAAVGPGLPVEVIPIGPPRVAIRRPRLTLPVRWGLATAAALLVGFLVLRPDDRVTPWRAEGVLTADQLGPDTRRGADEPLPPAATPRAAAILGLAALLNAPAGTPPAISVPVGMPREIRRFDVAGLPFEVVVPTGLPEVSLWRLDRPALDLHVVDITAASGPPPARIDLDAHDRLVVTYPVPGGYGSSPAETATRRP